jgi:hypothetical protein
MELCPQDVVVVLKLLASGPQKWTYVKLGKELSMSPSQVFRSVDRAGTAHLLDPSALPPPPNPITTRVHQALYSRPNRGNLKEFLVHGVKYAFPVQRGGLTRGLPTADAAPPLSHQLAQNFLAKPVWPYAEGAVVGAEFSPLYKNVPMAAMRDEKLYELLALVDAIREGRVREREIAIRELTTRIDSL